jgi:hypothetical protein
LNISFKFYYMELQQNLVEVRNDLKNENSKIESQLDHRGLG